MGDDIKEMALQNMIMKKVRFKFNDLCENLLVTWIDFPLSDETK